MLPTTKLDNQLSLSTQNTINPDLSTISLLAAITGSAAPLQLNSLMGCASAAERGLSIASREEQPTLSALASALNGQQGQVIVFNFSKVPQLCGAAGCLVAAYAKVLEVDPPALSDDVPGSYRLVWRQYLRSPLPKGMPLLFQHTPPNQPDERFPTLVANQIEDNRVRQLVFSWSGSRYKLEKVVLNEQLVEEPSTRL